MGTRYLFKKAVKISHNLGPRDRKLVQKRCKTIRKSQEDLLEAADTAMFHCTEKCRGICCKSLDIDSIFSLWDFIFILTLAPQLKNEIQERLDAYTSLYLSPCPFLKENIGPCIFPSGIKAQICVITFCSNDEKIAPPIKAVNYNFYVIIQHLFLELLRFLKKVSLFL